MKHKGSVRGDFTLQRGQVLTMVGQQGKDGGSYDVGRGGTFVALDDNTLLIVAGGGAGEVTAAAATSPVARQGAAGNGNGGTSGNDGRWCGCGGEGSAGGGLMTVVAGRRLVHQRRRGRFGRAPRQCVDSGIGGFGGGGNGGNGGGGGGGYQGGTAALNNPMERVV